MKAKTLILALATLALLLPAEEKKSANRWQSLFTEPFETLYIIMGDRVAFKFSNQDENQVSLTIETLEKQLRTPERSYKMKDIAVIIHNHFKRCRFSPEDRKFYRKLKRYGFNGRFLLYCHRTNQAYDIEDEKNL